MLDRPGVLREENHRETTEAWLAAFDAALANRSAAELSQLFVADSHWRNLATGYKGPDHLLTQLFGADVAKRVGRGWGRLARSICSTHSLVVARLDRAIQYAEAYRFQSSPSLEYWITRLRG